MRELEEPALLGPLAEEVASAPTQETRLITRSSRIGSIGGFVTCANCCLK